MGPFEKRALQKTCRTRTTYPARPAPLHFQSNLLHLDFPYRESTAATTSCAFQSSAFSVTPRAPAVIASVQASTLGSGGGANRARRPSRGRRNGDVLLVNHRPTVRTIGNLLESRRTRAAPVRISESRGSECERPWGRSGRTRRPRAVREAEKRPLERAGPEPFFPLRRNSPSLPHHRDAAEDVEERAQARDLPERRLRDEDDRTRERLKDDHRVDEAVVVVRDEEERTWGGRFSRPETSIRR